MLTFETKAASIPWGHIAADMYRRMFWLGERSGIMAVWRYGGVAGIDLGAGLCAMEGDKRWMMRASWLRLLTRRKVRASSTQRSGSSREVED